MEGSERQFSVLVQAEIIIISVHMSLRWIEESCQFVQALRGVIIVTTWRMGLQRSILLDLYLLSGDPLARHDTKLYTHN